MRNRAKCKLCKSIIESFHPADYVECSCGEIGVDGGAAMRCLAKNFENFIRIDDNGNEIVVRLESDKEKHEPVDAPPKPSQEELLDMLGEMIRNLEKLPVNAMTTPVTHYDLLSALMLISSILRSR
jgi:hypothetical protein